MTPSIAAVPSWYTAGPPRTKQREAFALALPLYRLRAYLQRIKAERKTPRNRVQVLKEKQRWCTTYIRERASERAQRKIRFVQESVLTKELNET